MCINFPESRMIGKYRHSFYPLPSAGKDLQSVLNWKQNLYPIWVQLTKASSSPESSHCRGQECFLWGRSSNSPASPVDHCLGSGYQVTKNWTLSYEESATIMWQILTQQATALMLPCAICVFIQPNAKVLQECLWINATEYLNATEATNWSAPKSLFKKEHPPSPLIPKLWIGRPDLAEKIRTLNNYSHKSIIFLTIFLVMKILWYSYNIENQDKHHQHHICQN